MDRFDKAAGQALREARAQLVAAGIDPSEVADIFASVQANAERAYVEANPWLAWPSKPESD